MIIDFDKIPEAHIDGFKGGKGRLDTRNYDDGKAKIMYSTLRPGASSGLHVHEGNCEIVFVISGIATLSSSSAASLLSITMVMWRSAAPVSAIIAPRDIVTTWRI